MRHLFLASVCALAIAGCGNAPEWAEEPAQDAVIPSPENAGEWTPPAPPRAVAIASPVATLNRPEAYVCPDADARCARDVFRAATAKEADWLIRNGYPSPEERQRLQDLSVAQLETEAPGNEAATLELAKRHAEAGDHYHALGLVYPLARSGNLFAYHAFADLHALKGPRQDLLESGAYLRLAYILGDHRASEVLGERLSRFGPVEHRIIDRRAASLYQTLAESRAPDPRPFDEGD